MKTLVLLVAIGTIPAAAGIAASLPFWRNRHFPNSAIFSIGLVILLATLIAGLIPVFMTESSAPGFLCILVSALNLVVYRYYERFLFTRRCPHCGFPALRIRSHRKGRYQLHCRNCNLFSDWQATPRTK